MLAIITYLINPDLMEWSSFPCPYLSVGLESAWDLWRVRCLSTFHTLGPNLTDTVVIRKEHTLVTNGPYRWVRHPFYLSGLLAVLPSPSPPPTGSSLLPGSLAVLLLAIRSRKEEQNLIARFGEDYRVYMKRTGRFVPVSFRLVIRDSNLLRISNLRLLIDFDQHQVSRAAIAH